MGYDLDFRATVHLPSVFTAPDATSGAIRGRYPQGTKDYQTLDPTNSDGASVFPKYSPLPKKVLSDFCFTVPSIPQFLWKSCFESTVKNLEASIGQCIRPRNTITSLVKAFDMQILLGVDKL